MPESAPKTEKPKESHLDLSIPGNRPIMVSVMKPEGDEFDQLLQDLHMDRVRRDLNIREIERTKKGVNESNNFSQIDSSNKFSEGYSRCTGLIVAGIDEKTGRNISLLTHQDPNKFLFAERESFLKVLESKLEKFKRLCSLEKKTIDAVIFGGSTKNDGYYLEQIELLSEEIKKVLNFEPIIINGPKETARNDYIYYDNDNRRAYFERPEINPLARDFTKSELETDPTPWIFKPRHKA